MLPLILVQLTLLCGCGYCLFLFYRARRADENADRPDTIKKILFLAGAALCLFGFVFIYFRAVKTYQNTAPPVSSGESGAESAALSDAASESAGGTDTETTGDADANAIATDAEATNAEAATTAATGSDPADASVTVLPVEAGIREIKKYGNIVLTISPDSLRALGYEPTDMIHVSAGDLDLEMPICTSLTDVDSGMPVCAFKFPSDGGPEEAVIAINAGNFASFVGLGEFDTSDPEKGRQWVWAEGYDETTPIRISMSKKYGYAEQYETHRIAGTRSNNREDYPHLSDEEYANFREVSTTGIAPGVLYRSSSPVNPNLNRNAQADAALLDAGVKTILNLADSEAEMVKYADFGLTAYKDCDIVALDMGMDFTTDEFAKKFAQGLRFMIDHEGPYLIHCNEGKDRTGFVIAILECLMGADEEAIVDDYMLTYRNFYGVDKDSEQYSEIADINIKASLARAFSTISETAETNSLSENAELYLEAIGLTADEIEVLRERLRTEPDGAQAPQSANTDAKTTDTPDAATGIDYMALVNKLNPLPEGWEDALKIVTTTNSVGDEVEVEAKAYDAYLLLKDDLEQNDGIYLELDSARRSVAAQQDIMDRFIEKYGPDYAAKTVAQPGFSEHHTGLALDLYFKLKNEDGTFTDVYYNEDMVQYPEIWEKIHAKLADYGFILRYLDGREHITGYGYEPWHIRYLDSTDVAKDITARDITLEEYLLGRKAPVVEIDYGTSELYTKEDLDAAIVQIKCKFAGFRDCELHSLTYAGDDANNEENLEWLKSLNDGTEYVQVMEFFSSFGTGDTVSLEPNSEYTDYQWWLARTKDGGWEVVSRGYE